MIQGFIRNPSQHVQINAAMFGQLIFEPEQMNEEGKVYKHSHTWLIMFQQDLDSLEAIDEGVSLQEYIDARAGIHTLLHDIEARDMFCAIDVSQLRAKYHSVCIPPPGYVTQVPLFAGPPLPPETEQEITHPHMCNIDIEQGKCQARFRTQHALIQHIVHTIDSYHSMRQYVRMITLTNQ